MDCMGAIEILSPLSNFKNIFNIMAQLSLKFWQFYKDAINIYWPLKYLSAIVYVLSHSILTSVDEVVLTILTLRWRSE